MDFILADQRLARLSFGLSLSVVISPFCFRQSRIRRAWTNQTLDTRHLNWSRSPTADYIHLDQPVVERRFRERRRQTKKKEPRKSRWHAHGFSSCPNARVHPNSVDHEGIPNVSDYSNPRETLGSPFLICNVLVELRFEL